MTKSDIHHAAEFYSQCEKYPTDTGYLTDRTDMVSVVREDLVRAIAHIIKYPHAPPFTWSTFHSLVESMVQDDIS